MLHNDTTDDTVYKADGRVLIMTAVPAERDAIKQTLKNDSRFDIRASGAGPVAAAVHTMKALAEGSHRVVISAGIGGGFPAAADIGSIVLSTEIIAADLGAETPDGFLSIDELGFGSSKISVDPLLVRVIEQQLKKKGLDVQTGPILTVSSATGTEETGKKRAALIPGAAAEAMEGFGVAAAALQFGLPVVEMRAVSNRVGLRDRNAWKIDEALRALAEASAVLPEVLL